MISAQLLDSDRVVEDSAQVANVEKNLSLGRRFLFGHTSQLADSNDAQIWRRLPEEKPVAFCPVAGRLGCAPPILRPRLEPTVEVVLCWTALDYPVSHSLAPSRLAELEFNCMFSYLLIDVSLY